LSGRLESGEFHDVLIFSAFVTSSGTQRLAPGLRDVVRTGGRVRALIGVRNGLTSLQAVGDLLAAGVEVWGLDTGGSILYHPKIYALRGANAGWVSVGSSNLTGDGMYRNIETNTILELNLGTRAELATFSEIIRWWDRFGTAYPQNTRRIRTEDIDALFRDDVLADEVAVSRRISGGIRTSGGGRGRLAPDVPRISVPALPPISGQRAVKTRPQGGLPAREEPSLPTPTQQTRFFAMTLSAHDASKPTGTKGTSELSLPRPATEFFPPMSVTSRKYPDAYFNVRLNDGQQASVVEYRIWERPSGEVAGHADLRINVKHDTVDLATPGGADIILFETTPEGVGPAYDVWVISQNDPNHAALLRRCTHTVVTRGAAVTKRYGFF